MTASVPPAAACDGPGVSDRLRWQCRRGMLEIDLLLNGFLDNGYHALTASGRDAFERLLGYPDAVLQEWLLGRGSSTDGEIAAVIGRIRRAVEG